MLVCGLWVFQLFEKEGQVQGTNQYLYVLRYALDTAGLYPQIKGRSHVMMVNATDSEQFVTNIMQAVSTAKVKEEMHGVKRVMREIHKQMFKQPVTREAERFALGKYLVYRGQGNAEFKSCEMALIEWAKVMNIHHAHIYPQWSLS